MGCGFDVAEAGGPKRRNRGPGVRNLMPADEPRAGEVEQPVLVLIDKPPALLMGAEILAADEDRPGADRRRTLAQHRVGVGMLLRRDHGRARRA